MRDISNTQYEEPDYHDIYIEDKYGDGQGLEDKNNVFPIPALRVHS